MSAKTGFITAYFSQWKDDASKTARLLETNDYHCEALLLLSCYIGALAAIRFPRTDSDREAYQRTVIRYSGLKSLYDKIDLLFFYQWPRSVYRRSGSSKARAYSRIKGYTQLKKALARRLGDENAVMSNPRRRYRPIKRVVKFAPPGMDPRDVLTTLRLFSLSEILYRFARCHAVHDRSFPLVTKVHCTGGTTRYEDNHLLTGQVLLETVKNIINNLEKECVTKCKMPHELSNR
jgi:hypothetical protein